MIVRKLREHAGLREHHEVTDPMMSVIGTLFAVLLGFMVANSMQRFEQARINVQQESNALMDLYRLAEGLPPADCVELRAHIRHYIDDVIFDEWPKMARKETSDEAEHYYDLIWSDCASFKPQNEVQHNIDQKMLDVVSTFGDCRRLRLYALHTGLPAVLWGVLIAGGAATIGFTYLFRINDPIVQMLMTALLSLIVCLNMFLLACYADPFAGEVAVHPTSFLVDRDIFKKIADPAVVK